MDLFSLNSIDVWYGTHAKEIKNNVGWKGLTFRMVGIQRINTAGGRNTFVCVLIWLLAGGSWQPENVRIVC